MGYGVLVVTVSMKRTPLRTVAPRKGVSATLVEMALNGKTRWIITPTGTGSTCGVTYLELADAEKAMAEFSQRHTPGLPSYAADFERCGTGGCKHVVRIGAETCQAGHGR